MTSTAGTLDFARDGPLLALVERLNLLSVALGLACLAGLNLYLTVFATGLAIHFHWIVLATQYQSLSILGDPIVITISGVLFLLEFFADKIPWIDSIWDAVHTIIRPIGGALLAIQVLGHSTPMLDVVIVLLAGTTALATHTAKAATRLLSNTSPEPFSNIALSVGEDAVDARPGEIDIVEGDDHDAHPRIERRRKRVIVLVASKPGIPARHRED